MSSTNCPDCSQSFSRKDAFLRHHRQKHSKTNGYRPPPPLSSDAYPPPPPLSSDAYPPPPPPSSDAYPPPPPPPPSSDAYPPPPPPLPPPPPPSSDAYPPPPPPPPSSDAYPPPPPPLPPPPPPSSDAYPPPPPPPSPYRELQYDNEGERTVLYHPFTMMISGPTACGKTTFVKELLHHHETRIQPSVQRIVWLYRRWQPLYTVIHKTVSPRVEFIQGIPTDLDDDDYFDSSINNLLILDDLFSEAGKDKRITDLFTEGSHHRSLSVISINQNLFSNKDPTQRRNCHYLVLFNNPVDRQTMMTLARQMYAGNTGKFLKAFTKATKSPYGYLLVDLEPFTSENDRLKYAIEWPVKNQDISKLINQIQGSPQPSIKENNSCDINHSSVGFQPVHIAENKQQQDIMAEKGHACDDCGLLFDTSHDVQRHVKRGWCSELEEPVSKKTKMEYPKSDSDIEQTTEENDAYNHLWKLAKKESQNKFDQLYEKYISEGENEDDATDMAKERVEPLEKRYFFERYSMLLDLYWFSLMDNPTHNSIIQQINILREKGVSLPSAVKRVLNKNRSKFEDLFETEMSDEESEESESDTDEEETIERI